MSASKTLLKSGNWIASSKPIAHYFGSNDASILLMYLIERSELGDDEGLFVATVENIRYHCCIGDKPQRRILDIFVQAGLLLIQLKGLPATRHFKLAYDFDMVLDSIIEKGAEMQKGGRTSSTQMAELNIPDGQNLSTQMADTYKTNNYKTNIDKTTLLSAKADKPIKSSFESKKVATLFDSVMTVCYSSIGQEYSFIWSANGKIMRDLKLLNTAVCALVEKKRQDFVWQDLEETYKLIFVAAFDYLKAIAEAKGGTVNVSPGVILNNLNQIVSHARQKANATPAQQEKRQTAADMAAMANDNFWSK